MTRISKVKDTDETDGGVQVKSDANKALQKYAGISTYDEKGQYREADTIISELQSKWDGLTDAQKSEISFALAATRQTAKFKTILDSWTDSMYLAQQATENSEGTAERTQEKYDDSYAARMQDIQNKIDEFWIKLYNNQIFDWLIDFADAFASAFNWIANIPNVGPILALGTMFAGVVKLISGVKSLRGFIKDVNTTGFKDAVANRQTIYENRKKAKQEKQNERTVTEADTADTAAKQQHTAATEEDTAAVRENTAEKERASAMDTQSATTTDADTAANVTHSATEEVDTLQAEQQVVTQTELNAVKTEGVGLSESETSAEELEATAHESNTGAVELEANAQNTLNASKQGNVQGLPGATTTPPVSPADGGSGTGGKFGGVKGALGSVLQLAKMHPIMSALMVATPLISSIKSHYEEWKKESSAEAISKKSEAIMSSYSNDLNSDRDRATTIQSLSKEYAELSKGVDATGKSISLNTDQMDRYHEVSNKIADLLPDMVDKYDEYGNAILKSKGNIDAITESLNKSNDATYKRLINGDEWQAGDKDSYENAQKIIDNYNNLSDLGFWDTITEPSKMPINDQIKALKSLSKSSKQDIATEYNLNSKYNKRDRSDFESLLSRINGAVAGGNDTGLGDTVDELLDNIDSYDDEHIKTLQSKIEQQAIELEKVPKERSQQVGTIASAFAHLNSTYKNATDGQKEVVDILLDSIDYTQVTDKEGKVDVSKLQDYVKDTVSIIPKNEGAVKAVEELKKARDKYLKGQTTFEELTNQYYDFDTKISKTSLSNSQKKQLKQSDLFEDSNSVNFFTMRSAVQNKLRDSDVGKVYGMKYDELLAAYKADTKPGTQYSWQGLQALMVPATNDTNALLMQLTEARKGLKEYQKLRKEVATGSNPYEELNIYSQEIQDYQNTIDAITKKVKQSPFKVSDMFSDVGDGGFVKNLDACTKKVSELAEAQNKYNSGTLKGNDLLSLLKDYPELGDQADTLGVGIENLKQSASGDILSSLNDQINLTSESIQSLGDKASPALENSLTQLTSLRDLLLEVTDGSSTAMHAFDEWQTATQTANAGDNYKTMESYLDTFKTAHKRGEIGTDDYKKFAALWRADGAGVNNAASMAKAKRYLTPDSNKGIRNFLSDLEKKDLASKGKNGQYTIKSSNLEADASKMGISSSAMRAMFGRLEDFGFDTNYVNSVEDAESKLKEFYTEKAKLEAKKSSGKENWSTAESERLEQLNKKIKTTKSQMEALQKTAAKDKASEVKSAQDLWGSYYKQWVKIKKDTKTYDKDTRDSIMASLESEMQNVVNKYNLKGYKYSKTAKENYEESHKKEDKKEKTTYQTNLLPQEQAPAEKTKKKATEQVSDETSKNLEKAVTNANDLNTSIDTTQSKVSQLDFSGLTTPTGQAYEDVQKMHKMLAEMSGKTYTIDVNTKSKTKKNSINTNESSGHEGDPRYKNVLKTKTKAKANGTLSKSSAFANGNIGRGHDLIGELGAEMLVRDGQWHLMGQNGAEMFHYKPNDIIFNASQTKQLLENGEISSRGSAYAKGTNSNKDVQIKYNKLTNSNTQQVQEANYKLSKVNNIVPTNITTINTIQTTNTRTNNSNTKSVNNHSLTNGNTLVGELGRELLVRDGKWSLLGESGAESFNKKPGDIVFNNKQTEELIAKGATQSRGEALAGGNAFASTTKSANTVSTGSLPPAWTDSKSSKTKNKGKSSNKNSSKNKAKEVKDWFAQFFDWIEVRLQRLDEKEQRYAARAEIYAGQYTRQNNQIDKQLKVQEEKIKANTKGAKRYQKHLDEVVAHATYQPTTGKGKNKKKSGSKQRYLTPGIIKRIQNGTIDISKYSEGRREAIQEYQTWYDKMIKCKDAIDQLRTSQAQLIQQKLDNIVAQYDRVINHIQSKIDLNTSKATWALAQSSNNTKDSNYVDAMNAGHDSIAQANKEAATALDEYKTYKNQYEEDVKKTFKLKVKKKNGKYKYEERPILTAAQRKEAETKLNNLEQAYYDKMTAADNLAYQNTINANIPFESTNALLDARIAGSQARISKLDSTGKYSTWGDLAKKYTNEQLNSQKEQNKTRIAEYKALLAEYNRNKDSMSKATREKTEAQLVSLDTEITKGEANAATLEKTLKDMPIAEAQRVLETLQSMKQVTASLASLHEERLQYQEEDYTKQIELNDQEITKHKELSKLNRQLAQEAKNKGDIAHMDAYNKAADEADTSVNNLTADNDKLKNSLIDNVYRKPFQDMREEIERVQTRLEALNSMFYDEELYKENGELTDFGLASLQNDITDAAKAREAIQSAKDEYNVMLTKEYGSEEQKQKALTEQQQKIFSLQKDAVSKSKAVVDAGLKSYQKIIDKLKEIAQERINALNTQKSMYDYDKNLKSKNKEITLLQQKLQAIKNVNTAEAQAQRQSLEAQVADQKEELDNMTYEHKVELVTNGLNDFTKQLDEDYQVFSDAVHTFDGSIKFMADLQKQINNSGTNTMKSNANAISYADGTYDKKNVTAQYATRRLQTLEKNLEHYQSVGNTARVENIKNQINDLKRTYGFASGGIVKDIAHGKGEDGLTFVKRGELLFSPEQAPYITNILDNIVPINNGLDALNQMITNASSFDAKPTSIVLNVENGIKVDGDVIESTIPDLQAMQKQMEQNISRNFAEQLRKTGW